MSRATTSILAALALAIPCLSASAGPADLMPEPIKGWSASNAVYGESVIEEGAPQTPDTEAAAEKRIEVSRDYSRDGGGLRISLNTHDMRGVQLISYVNETQQGNPEKAAELAAKGIVPFRFKTYSGVTMRAGEDGDVTGAALELGGAGTLTLEGISDGRPDTVALDHVKAYLGRMDLERMSEFVRQANARRTGHGD